MRIHQPWTTLSSQQVLDTPYLKIRREQTAVPNGPIIDDYYIIENFGWVGIVPFTEDGCFLLNRQYKHGIGLAVLEFPAGAIDPHEHEEPVLTAQREVMENLLVTPKELLQMIHEGSFAVQGQVAAAYMAMERLGFLRTTF